MKKSFDKWKTALPSIVIDTKPIHDAIQMGTKHDQDKVRLELLPIESLEEVAKVLTHGANKYQPYNWTKGFKFTRLVGACMRHLFAWTRGEDKDPETGLSHLAHAACCLLFLIWMQKFRPNLDDRFKSQQEVNKES